MPNWCDCDLIVCGPKAQVTELLDFAKSEDSEFDFEKFVPYPIEFRRLDEAAEAWDAISDRNGQRPKDGFNSGGYEWCVEHWGTKWNACRVRMDEPYEWCGEASVEIHFSTAWSPPQPIVRKASALFPDLTFDLRYFEGGVGFNGWFICKRGEVIRDETGDYFGNRGG